MVMATGIVSIAAHLYGMPAIADVPLERPPRWTFDRAAQATMFAAAWGVAKW